MKKLIVVLLVGLVAMHAQAADARARARVISADPIYSQSVQPQCWDETVSVRTGYNYSDRMAGQVVGGVVGGMLGHQIGHGHGRGAATAGGAIIGSIVGGNVASAGPEYSTRTVRHCSESRQEYVSGYMVTYEYKGERYTATMSKNPGKYVNVRVRLDVYPDE